MNKKTYTYQNNSGGISVKSNSAFCAVVSDVDFISNFDFSDILDSIDAEVKLEHNAVTQNALNNCHGDWYEWIISFISWNYRVDSNKKLVLVKLPNVSSFEVSKLYTKRLHDLIIDLKSKVRLTANVELISSNPDFVIIDTTRFDINMAVFSKINKKILSVTESDIEIIESLYQDFIGQCSIDDIVGYLSIKTSLRPDRRLQLSHEGSLMKAIYVHLQTRDWIIDPVGIKYYAASTKISDADIQGLSTVATHSITNVQSKPQAAVDRIFEINNKSNAEYALNIILSK